MSGEDARTNSNRDYLFVAYLCFHAVMVLAALSLSFQRSEQILAQLHLHTVIQAIATVGVFLVPVFVGMFIAMVYRMIHGRPAMWRIVVADLALFLLHILAIIPAIQ